MSQSNGQAAVTVAALAARLEAAERQAVADVDAITARVERIASGGLAAAVDRLELAVTAAAARLAAVRFAAAERLGRAVGAVEALSAGLSMTPAAPPQRTLSIEEVDELIKARGLADGDVLVARGEAAAIVGNAGKDEVDGLRATRVGPCLVGASAEAKGRDVEAVGILSEGAGPDGGGGKTHVIVKADAPAPLLGVPAAQPSGPAPWEPERLTTGEAAKYLKVAPRTVSKWCDSGRLKHSREAVTHNRLIAPADLAAFMTENGMEIPAALASLAGRTGATS